MGYYLQSGGRARFSYSMIATEIILGALKETVPSQNYVGRVGAAERMRMYNDVHVRSTCQMPYNKKAQMDFLFFIFYFNDLAMVNLSVSLSFADTNELETFKAIQVQEFSFFFLISKWLK